MLVSLGTLPSFGAPPERLTLQEAWARVLDANLQVTRARLEVTAGDAQKSLVKSAVKPRLGLTAAGIRNSAEVAFGSPEDSRVVLPRNDWNYRLTVSQPIFAGRRDRRALEQASLAIESARSGALGTEERVLLDVSMDYLAVVQADELIEVERKSLGLAERRRQQAADFLEAGETTKVDVLRAEAAKLAAERRLLTVSQAREDAMGRLRVSLGLPGSLDVAPPTLGFPDLPDAEELLRAAEERWDVVLAAQSVEIAHLEVSKQRGAYWPVLSADAGYVRQEVTFPKDEYAFVGLRLSVPIYQGGEVGARIALARVRAEQAEQALIEARRQAVEDARRAYEALRTAEKTLELAESQLQASEAEYEQMFDLYRRLEATALDLDSSETALAEGRRAVATSKLDRLLAEVQVRAAAGVLELAVRRSLEEAAR